MWVIEKSLFQLYPSRLVFLHPSMNDDEWWVTSKSAGFRQHWIIGNRSCKAHGCLNIENTPLNRTPVRKANSHKEEHAADFSPFILDVILLKLVMVPSEGMYAARVGRM